jgi:hypothetical protein
MDSPAVVETEAWKKAGELGQWPTVVRPKTMNRHRVIYEWSAATAS